MAKNYIAGIFLFLMFTFLTGCKEDSSPVSPVVSNSVEDTWVNEGGFEMTFNVNGTVTGSWVDYSNELLVRYEKPAQIWTFNATHILIDGNPAYPYTVNNDTLIFKYIDDSEFLLTRKK